MFPALARHKKTDGFFELVIRDSTFLATVRADGAAKIGARQIADVQHIVHKVVIQKFPQKFADNLNRISLKLARNGR
jgi:hypothetical protein